MSEITYSLKGNKSSSDEFYRVLEDFTRRTEDFVYEHSKNILYDMQKNHPENESMT